MPRTPSEAAWLLARLESSVSGRRYAEVRGGGDPHFTSEEGEEKPQAGLEPRVVVGSHLQPGWARCHLAFGGKEMHEVPQDTLCFPAPTPNPALERFSGP